MNRPLVLRLAALLVALLALLPAVGCNYGDGGNQAPEEEPPVPDDDATDDDTGPDDDATDDDTEEPFPDVPRFRPIVERPEGSVLPDSVVSCPVFQDTQCVEGTLWRCDIYDGANERWVDEPDPMLEQTYWYDRYYDLYQTWTGPQHVGREFTEPMPPGTPEAVWSDPDKFLEHFDFGDGSGWTGTALQAIAARYQQTGTPADYERMLEHMEGFVFLYEATDIPGMIMRAHFAMLEEGAPKPHGHPGKAVTTYIQPEDWHFRYPLSAESLARLPAFYTEGIEIDGTHYDVTPVWMGDASRDMYVRSLPGLMLAYDLLGEGPREDRLREVVREVVPCTLKRLKKFRIRNLQENDVLREAIAEFLAGGRLRLDPGDLDLTTLDTIVGYYMEQPNSRIPDYMDYFDPTCPDTVPMEPDPEYDVDGSDLDEVLAKLGEIVMRENDQGEVPIAWTNIPSVRGSDALFLVQWALFGYYLTGEEQFLAFVDRLWEETEFWPVVNQMGSFYTPKWCAPHFAPSLLYPTLWNIQARVDRTAYPEFWTNLATAIAEEERYKELADTRDAYFGILYDAMVDETIDPGAGDYVQSMVQFLREAGQYQVADKMEPRRDYTIDLLYNPPPDFDEEIQEITQEDIDLCEEPLELFGIVIEPGQTPDMLPRARYGLPIRYRYDGNFLWEQDPYVLFRDYGADAGKRQWPMQGQTVAFWTGRMQGTIAEGRGMALAWRDTGEACE